MKRASLASSLAVSACVALASAAVAADPPAESGPLGPEILHMPLLDRHAEQGILRPVPITVDLPDELAGRARRVLVHYRLWGEPDWTTIALRHGPGARFEGAVPCIEISTVTGDLRYYIRVYDADDRVIASAGSLAKPYLVAIKHDSTLAPGAPRTAKCPDPADCPRGLPGCPSERVIDVPCRADADCQKGMTCGFRGYCERESRRRNWVSLSVEQGLGIMSATGACGLYSQEHDGYACFRADEKQYVGSPVLTNEPLAVGPAPTRIVLGYDRLVHTDTSIGVRLGVAVRGIGPTPREGTAFVPVSFAARLTHWFGADPFASARLRPFAFVTGGYEMVDIESTIRVREDPTKPSYQPSNDLVQELDLWKRAGDGFVGAGGGLAVPIGPRTAVVAEIAALGLFPFGALLIAPSAGLMVGF